MEPLIKTNYQFNLNFSIFSPFPNRPRDVEMTTFQNKGYTSLKDLLPVSPPRAASPTVSWKESWREIPIKDPLLQHAAWAYLRPMAESRDDDGYGGLFLKRLKKNCWELLRCVAGVVLVVVGRWFWGRSAADFTVGDKFH